MPWPVPLPGAISGQAASQLEAMLPGIDARSPNTVATAFTRVTEMGLQDLYFYQAYLAAQLMPDTATDWLGRHGAIWGVAQDPATAASGSAIATGTVGTAIPIGVTMTAPSGAAYATTAAAAVGSNGSVDVPVAATVAGSAGNMPAGTVLTITSPVTGLSPQTLTVDANGITGGLDLESTTDWQARILKRIRTPPMGGSSADYEEWAQAALPGVEYVSVLANWGGLGNVGVAVAMTGPAVPSGAEITTIQDYIDLVAPVTAVVSVLAASLNPVNVTLHLMPDSTALRASIEAALAVAFQQNAEIGATT